MSKILLGVALGYFLSDMIDELLGKNRPEKPQPPKDDTVVSADPNPMPEPPSSSSETPPPSPPVS